MAEFFAEIARRVLALSGLAVLLDVVLPRGNMQRCARLVVSLLLVGVLVEPVAEILPWSNSAATGAVTAAIFTDGVGKNVADNTAEIIAAGSRMADEAEEAAKEQLTQDLVRQIGALVRGQDGVADCEIEVEFADLTDLTDFAADGAEDIAVSAGGSRWGRVLIMLAVDGAVEEKALVADRVRGTVAAFYALPESDVRVSLVTYGGE